MGVIVLKHVPVGLDMHRAFLYAIQKMDSVVDQEYVVVLVCPCQRQTIVPHLRGYSRCTTCLTNATEKNMKNLYVLHPASGSSLRSGSCLLC